MRRKSLIFTGILAIVLLGGIGGAFYGLLRHEPNLYAAGVVPPGEARQTQSREFEQKAVELYNEIKYEADWHQEFTEQQVNSWLAEDFIKSELVKLIPPEITEPRVAFRPGQVFLAFRYGGADWNTVVSVQAKVWVVKREANVIAVQIEEIHAGALPLATKILQEQITEGARRQNIDVSWYRNEGFPVAVLRLQADRREPNIQLQELELRQGAIFVKGRSLDPELRATGEAPFVLKQPPAQ